MSFPLRLELKEYVSICSKGSVGEAQACVATLGSHRGACLRTSLYKIVLAAAVPVRLCFFGGGGFHVEMYREPSGPQRKTQADPVRDLCNYPRFPGFSISP